MGDPRDHLGIGRYAITSKLGEGGMGAVFRAFDRLTGIDVAVKRLSVRRVEPEHAATELAQGSGGEDPTEVDEAPTRHDKPGAPPPKSPAARSDSVPAMRLAIATEFRILASLRHPNIISVLDYGFDEAHDPYVVLEVLDAARPVTAAARGRSLRDRVLYIAQILRALDYLHRRGIRHRDLKPSNVMVADERVRVLDFGLALESGERHRPAGTFGYIAPEIMRGEPHTAVADLYAAGVVAYEILTGRHPFGRSEDEVLRHAGQRPPALVLEARELGAEGAAALSDTVLRLLEPEPERRPSSAAQALRLLARTGVLGETEDDDIRKSMVGAARLVGRHAERSQLRAALGRARKGQGGVVAVVGDSGAGKSRLVDDLRTNALVAGCIVVDGGELAQHGAAYQSWQAPLRRLALHVPPQTRGIAWPFLTLIVPDIGELIGIGPMSSPPMDPQTLQIQMMMAAESLVRAASGPTVILLEDLHWAGGETLALLGWMARVAAELPLLIVATTRPEAAAAVCGPGVEVVEVRPLERRDLEELSIAVLGPLGDRADLIDLLEHGTGGVPLYVVEALRMLAAQAGSLDEIGTMKLPASLDLEVLDRALRDRLARLPGPALRLCQLAALAGPDLDLGLLAGVAPDLDLVRDLAEAEQAGVLVADVGGWHFAHDRVRQVLVASIAPDEQRALHRRLATWLDRAGDDPVALAWHWGQAGEPAREGAWAAAAADALLMRAAYPRAHAAFLRALALLDARGLAPADRDRAELRIQLGLGTCALILDGFASRVTAAAYDRAAALCESLGITGGAEAFPVLFGQATVHLFRGDIESSVNLAERALHIALEAGDVDLEIEGRFALSNAQFWFGDLVSCERNLQRVLELWTPERAPLHIERFGQNPRVTCMTGGAWGAWAAGRPDEALRRAEETVVIARQGGHNFSEAIAVQIVAFVHALRRDVDATLTSAETLVRYGAPYPSYMILARTLRAWALAHKERDLQYLGEMRGAWAHWQAIGQGAAQTFITGLLADAFLLFGHPEEALAIAREGITWAEIRKERPLLADVLCLAGKAQCALGDLTAARATFAAAREAAQSIGAGTLVLRVAVAWATLELDEGDAAAARAILAPAIDAMTEGADTADARAAFALLTVMEIASKDRP